MFFEAINNITENFCNAHSFEAFGEPVFDYDHQCYNHDVRSPFYNSLANAAFESEKLTKILVRLTEKEILNNKEKLTIYILRMIESFTEKHDKYEDEYLCKSNRAKSNEELNALHREHYSVTRDVERIIKEFYSLIEDLEDSNVNLREKCSSAIFQYREIGKYLDDAYLKLAQHFPEREGFETEERYLKCKQYHKKKQAAEYEEFEAEYQEYETLIASSFTQIEQQLSEPNQEAQNMKLAS